jgi:PAS domain S-box-containing protein
LKKLEEEKYDVIISDYKMPAKDGLELLKELREKGNTIPFIMFTGKGREEVAIKALNLGANQYLNKVGDTETVYTELAHSIMELARTKKAEEKQCESENKFRNLFEKADDGLVFVDPSGIIVDINQRAVEIAEKRREDIVGRSFVDLGLVRSKDIPFLLEKLEQHAMDKPTERFEFEIERKDGKKSVIEISSTSIQKNRELAGFLAIVRDVTERKMMQDALTDNEARLRAIVSSSPDPITILDLNGNIVELNQAAMKLHGFSREEEVLGKSCFNYVVPRDKARAMELFKKTLMSEDIRNAEICLLTMGGTELFTEISGSVVRDAHGLPECIVLVTRDVTEREKTDETLRESEERYSRLSAAASEGIGISEHGRIIDANDQLAKMLGYELSELIGKAALEFVALESRDLVTANMQKEYEGPYEHLALRKDGSVFPVEIRARPIHYKGRTARVTVIRDMTERKKLEESLRDSEKNIRKTVSLLNATLDSTAEGVLVVDPDGKITTFNKQLVEMWRIPKDVVLSNAEPDHVSLKRVDGRALDFLTEQLKSPDQFVKNARELFLAPDVETNGDLEFKDGRVFEFHYKPQHADGAVVGRVWSFRDVTEHRKAENARSLALAEQEDQHRLLEESQQKFAGLFNGNPEATVYVDPNMHILDVNPRFGTLFGYSLNEVRGKHINDVVVPENLLEEGKRLDTKAAEGYVYHDTLRRRKDGSLIPVSVSAAPIHVQDKLIGYVWLYKDISQRKTAEESLKESEEKFKALFAGGPEPSVYLDSDFHILDVNRRFEQLFGYSLAEIKGKQLDDIVVQEGKKEEATTLNEKAVEGYVYHDTVRRRKDGSLVPVSVSAAPIVIKGRLSGIVGTYKDISDLKGAEEKLAVMNEKLSVVGSLTRHDVRNKLSVVTGNTYLLRKKLSEDPKALEYLEDAEAAVTQVIKIFDFARTYEKIGVEQLGYVDARKMFEEAVSLFSDLKGIEITNGCQGLTVLADSLLRQVFYNLIDNSLKYGEKTKQIRAHYKEASNRLELIYEDDGAGIPDDLRSNLFKEGVGKGTGYGLFMIKRICEVYGWSIQETGEQGKGVQFIMTIPNRNTEGKTLYKIQE